MSADSGHIYVHETGSVEATGHRVFAAPTEDGKLRPADIEKVLLHHEDEHTAIPKMVYITHPTENGGVYEGRTQGASRLPQRARLYLHADGARPAQLLPGLKRRHPGTWPTQPTLSTSEEQSSAPSSEKRS
ncbi:MAG: beta-eliminating lyase-related protein [Anaerovoracaceae bacterium]